MIISMVLLYIIFYDQVRWGRQVYHCTLATPYSLRLASVDTTGHCIIWDVGMTTPISEFSLGTRPFVDLQWLTTNVCACIMHNNDDQAVYRTHVETSWRYCCHLVP